MLESLLWLFCSLTFLIGCAIARVWSQETHDGPIILLYHRLRTMEAYDRLSGPERNFSIPIERFNEQLSWLQSSGYEFVAPDAIAAYFNGGPQSPRSALVTFDDGCESILRLAAPVLSERGIPAVVFVTTDPQSFVFEDQRRMSDAEIAELHAGGIAIGSHGVSHHGLNELSTDDLEHELIQSKTELERITGKPVNDIAIPLNFYDRSTLLACRAAGYRLIFTSNPGRVSPNGEPYEVQRIAVEGQMTLTEFQNSLRPAAMAQRRIVAWLKRIPPRCLGEARWMPIRDRIFQSPIGRFLHYRYLRVAIALIALAWLGAITALATHVL